MENRDDFHQFAVEEIDDSVRKTPDTAFSSPVIRAWIQFRAFRNAKIGLSDGTCELSAEAIRLLLIPASRVFKIARSEAILR